MGRPFGVNGSQSSPQPVAVDEICALLVLGISKTISISLRSNDVSLIHDEVCCVVP